MNLARRLEIRIVEIRIVPRTFQEALHGAALVAAFVLLGGILMFADSRPSARHVAMKPAIEAGR